MTAARIQTLREQCLPAFPSRPRRWFQWRQRPWALAVRSAILTTGAVATPVIRPLRTRVRRAVRSRRRRGFGAGGVTVGGGSVAGPPPPSWVGGGLNVAVTVDAVAGIVMSCARAPPSDQPANVHVLPPRVICAGAEIVVW